MYTCSGDREQYCLYGFWSTTELSQPAVDVVNTIVFVARNLSSRRTRTKIILMGHSFGAVLRYLSGLCTFPFRRGSAEPTSFDSQPGNPFVRSRVDRELPICRGISEVNDDCGPSNARPSCQEVSYKTLNVRRDFDAERNRSWKCLGDSWQKLLRLMILRHVPKVSDTPGNLFRFILTKCKVPL